MPDRSVDVALEQAEIVAMRQQYAGLLDTGPAYLPRVAQVAGLVVFTCGGRPDGPWLNQVVNVGLDRPTGEVDVDGALALVTLAGARDPVVLVADAVCGPALRSRLGDRGLTPRTPLLRMVAPAGGPQPETVLRLAVVGAEAADDVAAVSSSGFGLELPAWWTAPLGRPGWTHVVAYDGKAPVAVGGLHVAGDVGWVGAACTAPGARDRGAQSALLALRLRLAAEQGASRVSVKVEGGGASYRNLRRAGFTVSHGITQWRRVPPRTRFRHRGPSG